MSVVFDDFITSGPISGRNSTRSMSFSGLDLSEFHFDSRSL